jgi:tetratricopeptide (TPR) repeat protein
VVSVRRSLGVAGVVAAVALVALLVSGFLLSRRLPVDQARRFFRAPIEVGKEPPSSDAARLPIEQIEARFAFGEAAFREERYARAAEEFEAVVAHDPGGPLAGPAQWNLTRSRLRRGDGNGALDALDGLLRFYADFLAQESALLRKAIDHMATGEMAAALEAFDRMIEEQAGHELVPLAHALKARIHWNHGEPMAAMASFADLFAAVQDDVPAYRDLGGLLERYAEGDTSVADDFADRADEIGEGFSDIYRYLAARSLLEQNRFEDTREALEALQRAHPEGDFTHIVDLEHAWNLQRNGRPAEALAIFERLERATGPEQAQAFDRFFDIRTELPMGIARCQLDLGRYEKSVAAFERALAEHPRSIYVLENQLGLAMAYEKLGRLAEAARTLETAITDHPDEPRLWAVRQQLARIESQLGG